MRRLPFILLTALTLVSAGASARTPGAPPARQQDREGPQPTPHRAIPANLDECWLVPPADWRPARAEAWNAARDLGKASDLIAGGKHAQALPLIREAALAGTPLAGYATYLEGVAQAALDRRRSARATLTGLRASSPEGALADAVSLRLAEVLEADRDFATAATLYESVLAGKPAAPADLQLRLMRAARSAGDRTRASTAFKALRYEWPLSDEAAAAEREWPAGDPDPLKAGSPRVTRELARAERLFAARRFTQAREAFVKLRPHATGDAAELVPLRIAECDVSLRRKRGTREALRPFLDSPTRRAEARYFDLTAARDLGRTDEFVRLARALADQFPDTTWAEDALNALVTFYIIDDQDDRADEVQRELVSRFPTGRYTARAMWRTGWWAYRKGLFEDAAEIFERAAVVFPRSDYRPSYVYWAAKARERAGDTAAADARFHLTVVDYANSYYGRQAAARLAARNLPVPGGAAAARAWPGLLTDPDEPPTAELIRWLIAAGMHDSALAEVQHLERTRGSTPVLQATRAFLLNRTGQLRPAINLMRQVYPQFLAAGGETLPDEILKIIFPVDYWPLIRQHAAANGLDPYLVAALVAQESTFDKDIRSSANAYGLMQIVPATGRRWARRLGIKGFTTRKLTVPEINVRIGTAYLASLLAQFGSPHVALAGYNAGDSRAARWSAERRGMPQDEFIDDIPFAETQGYVRRILGTAEDYRRLYGGTSAATPPPPPPDRRPGASVR